MFLAVKAARSKEAIEGLQFKSEFSAAVLCCVQNLFSATVIQNYFLLR